MNVYDFDGTIYYTDCTIDFGIWCMLRHPKLLFTYFPKAIKYLIQYKRGKVPNCLMQRKVFSYLTMIDDFDVQIKRYWDKNEKKISAWYLAQKKPDDLIISASPLCIIEPIAKRLGVRCIASEYDLEFGVFTNNLNLHKFVRSFRDWGRDCMCASGQDNLCGHRFEGQYGELPAGYDHKFV